MNLGMATGVVFGFLAVGVAILFGGIRLDHEAFQSSAAESTSWERWMPRLPWMLAAWSTVCVVVRVLRY